MQKYVINGSKPLHGSVEISGAKNAAVAIIPAALLVEGVCRIENVPQISDVTLILRILQELGADVRLVNKHTVQIDCRHITSFQVPDELSRKMRASYYLIGALLGRFGQAVVSMPGGCDLGTRPIDLHIKSFQALGAQVEVLGGYVHANAHEEGLRGTAIYMDQASVGATMNAMLAAVRAEGPDAFHLGAAQLDAGLNPVLNKIVVKGLFIICNRLDALLDCHLFPPPAVGF